MCGWWQRVQAGAGGCMSAWAGTEVHGVRVRLRVIVSHRGTVALLCRGAVVLPLHCMGAGMWVEGGHVDRHVWVYYGTVMLHWCRCMDEGMGGCTGHGCVTLLRAEYGQMLAKGVRLLDKSTGSYGEPKMTRCR